MSYTDKLTAVKTKLSAVQTAVNALPSNEQKPVNVDNVRSSIEALVGAVDSLTA
jgi:hypothetical protein